MTLGSAKPDPLAFLICIDVGMVEHDSNVGLL